MTDTTQEWQEYERGKDYNRRLGIYQTNDKNERFYAGDQWQGVQANGLPTPIFNIFKRSIDYFIASILSQKIKMQVIAENISDDTEDEGELAIKQAAETITKYSEPLWERLKMDYFMRELLQEGALTGDLPGYLWWNPDIDTGQEAKGDIDLELPDSASVMFGNPNERRAQKQPYIIIEFRELVANLRTEAMRNGVDELEAQKIVADSDTQDKSGDRGKVELDNQNDSAGKATTIIKLWRNPDSGTIWFSKSTRTVLIRQAVDTRLKLYPIPWGNWTTRKNSYHGQAVGTGLVPNQIFINKMFAMVMLNLMYVAFPKAVYNGNLIDRWSNQIGEAIKVNEAEDIRNVAMYLQPGEMSTQVMNVIDASIRYTKDFIGASDSAMGNVKPENTSAIIAVSQQAAIPLENPKANLYQWVEDFGYICLDFMANYYGKRNITITEDGVRKVIPFDFSVLRDMKLKLKIDVGPSTYWSEIAAMQTLDNLLNGEKISFLQYLKRIPDGIIPDKEGLIKEIEEQEALMQEQAMMEQQAMQQQQMEQILAQMSPEEQQAFAMMSPEEQQAMMQQLMGGGGMIG